MTSVNLALSRLPRALCSAGSARTASAVVTGFPKVEAGRQICRLSLTKHRRFGTAAPQRTSPSAARLVAPSPIRAAAIPKEGTTPSDPAIPFRTHSSKEGVVAHTFFHSPTSTWQYVVADSETKDAILIDIALDFDPATSSITTTTADALLRFVDSQGYKVNKILETHAHADHLTAAQYLKQRLQAPVGIGKGIKAVQARFGDIYGIPKAELDCAFDELLEDGESFSLGRSQCSVVHLPGHTPDHVGYRCGSFIFVGDSIFLPDVGSARADFPGGSVSDLYESAQKLLALPDDVRIFSGHDYPTEGRAHSCSSTVAEQKAMNKHLREGTKHGDFSRMRSERDSGLSAPKLLHHSLQVNVRGGHLPRPERTGERFFKVPFSSTF